MAKFVVVHQRTECIMTTVEAETGTEAYEKYSKYLDENMDKVDRRLDYAYPLYDTYWKRYEKKSTLNNIARENNVIEILTLEEAMNRG